MLHHQFSQLLAALCYEFASSGASLKLIGYYFLDFVCDFIARSLTRRRSKELANPRILVLFEIRLRPEIAR
jgi:hypothetical protein